MAFRAGFFGTDPNPGMPSVLSLSDPTPNISARFNNFSWVNPNFVDRMLNQKFFGSDDNETFASYPSSEFLNRKLSLIPSFKKIDLPEFNYDSRINEKSLKIEDTTDVDGNRTTCDAESADFRKTCTNWIEKFKHLPICNKVHQIDGLIDEGITDVVIDPELDDSFFEESIVKTRARRKSSSVVEALAYAVQPLRTTVSNYFYNSLGKIN